MPTLLSLTGSPEARVKMTMTNDETYEFQVDGERFKSETPKVSVSTILEMAHERDASLGDPANLTLEDADGSPRNYRATDEVDLRNESAFITLDRGPTPVAHSDERS